MNLYEKIQEILRKQPDGDDELYDEEAEDFLDDRLILARDGRIYPKWKLSALEQGVYYQSHPRGAPLYFSSFDENVDRMLYFGTYLEFERIRGVRCVRIKPKHSLWWIKS
jgi:hypothetical protein